jgi:hypothetical protein
LFRVVDLQRSLREEREKSTLFQSRVKLVPSSDRRKSRPGVSSCNRDGKTAINSAAIASDTTRLANTSVKNCRDGRVTSADSELGGCSLT